MDALELKAKRQELREELELAIVERPDDSERQQRLVRLLAWNRRELTALQQYQRRHV